MFINQIKSHFIWEILPRFFLPNINCHLSQPQLVMEDFCWLDLRDPSRLPLIQSLLNQVLFASGLYGNTHLLFPAIKVIKLFSDVISLSTFSDIFIFLTTDIFNSYEAKPSQLITCPRSFSLALYLLKRSSVLWTILSKT